jgi:hypothetical protein
MELIQFKNNEGISLPENINITANFALRLYVGENRYTQKVEEYKGIIARLPTEVSFSASRDYISSSFWYSINDALNIGKMAAIRNSNGVAFRRFLKVARDKLELPPEPRELPTQFFEDIFPKLKTNPPERAKKLQNKQDAPTGDPDPDEEVEGDAGEELDELALQVFIDGQTEGGEQQAPVIR